MHNTLLLVLIVSLLSSLLPWFARAETTLSAESLSVDGFEVRQLSCTMEKSGPLGLLQVVGALASQKAQINDCVPEGAAFRVEWQWPTKTVKTLQSSNPSKNTCVEKRLAEAKGTVATRCTATLLVGAPKEAASAAANFH